MISNFPFPPATAIISITDTDAPPVKIMNHPDYLLRIVFDDIDIAEKEDNFCKLYTCEQAREIARFYHSIAPSVKSLICQCEYGQSRSAAIVAAILEYREKRGIEIFADDRYYPNKHVFRTTLEALKN